MRIQVDMTLCISSGPSHRLIFSGLKHEIQISTRHQALQLVSAILLSQLHPMTDDLSDGVCDGLGI
jgi:hypothetical protein